MSAFLNNPLTFMVSGWGWFWQMLAETDGRIMLLIGVVAWFALERAMYFIYDPLLKAFAVFGLVGVVLICGTIMGGTKAAPGGNLTFDRLYKPANVQDLQRVR